MSLILEALKKSEQQRQRDRAPSLQSIHQPVIAGSKKSANPWWALAVFVVLANFAFFGYWFWRHDGGALTPQVTQPEQTPAPVDTTATAKAATTTAENQSELSTQTHGDVQPEFTAITPRTAAPQPINPNATQRIEEIGELPDNVRNNLPAMTFSFHVYSDNPEQRTIIINDRRVREGNEISAGLTLQSITPDGVILLFQQHRIHISVLSEW